jgi:hypothetical protein
MILLLKPNKKLGNLVARSIHILPLIIRIYIMCSGFHVCGSFGARRNVQASGSESAFTPQRNAPALQPKTPAPVAPHRWIFRAAIHRPPNAHHELRRPSTRRNDGYSSSIVSTNNTITLVFIRQILSFSVAA